MKILNFGSLNIDNVYSMDHFVRPGETTASLKMEIFSGGKGLNQSVALAKAGAEVYHAGKVGVDGQMLIDVLTQYGADASLVKMTEGRTGHAIIQVDKNGQNCILLYGGANQEITAQDVDEVLSHFNKGDMLLLQNEISSIDAIIEKAYAKGMVLALNPSPISKELLQMDLSKITYFILNEIEGNEMTGEVEPEKIARKMRDIYPGCIVVLTLGKRGVMYYDGKSTYTHGIYDVQVVDTTAAGDTFTGFFLSTVMAGEPVPKALEYASIASSLAVSKNGAAPSIPTMEEVKSAHLTQKA
ncbi:ribokinase [Zongyangia hominis]|uniref:Ribokinase n=1 Tax=Zongyangia hominis TaxID=2763677 RepID=A0A926IBW5_9FIRM|nr:ribokinase [Zongyangia hominis]MBC8570495.1 ribokinase [Zongyangia hominis]